MLALNKRFVAAMSALELAGRGVSTRQRLIIQLRASFNNGCEYCINMHSKEASKKGMAELIDILQGDSELVSLEEKEQLLVRYVDMGTSLSTGFNPELHQEMLQEFGEQGLAKIIQAVVSINAWNRIGVLSQK